VIRVRRLSRLALTLVLALGLSAVAIAARAEAATGCRVAYAVTNQWQGGFGASVTVTNLGDPVTGWNLTWSFAAGQSVTQAWNATVTQAGSQVTAKNVDYNSNIPTGGDAGFGFNGAWTAANTSGWNATYAPTSGQVSAANLSYNGTLAPGATTDIGFQATHTGNTAEPTAFTLNGVPCEVA
jgi:cellulase/cellobiase CelA1